ncbi:MAG: hypothetical protein NTX25_08650 [Proteobacteria bacterium]|nr:hypothetical protein [Pseudomonadota bacterium]
MAKILEFKSAEQRREETITHKLVKMADEIDQVLMRHLIDEEIDPREMVGVLSHRLGTLMNRLEEKDELWYVCQKVMKKQAQID